MTAPLPGEAVEFPRRDYDPQRYSVIFARLRNTVLLSAAYAGAATALVGGFAEAVDLIGPPKSQTPYFQTFRDAGCYVTEDARQVYPTPRRGIDDLIIRNVQGVSSETGPGSRCLAAARDIIILWSRTDSIKFGTGQVGYDPSDIKHRNPVLQASRPYLVPVEVSPKPIQ